MSGTLAAALGGAAGAVTLVGIVIIFVRYCLLHRRSVSGSSETNSSEPSLQGNAVTQLLFIRVDSYSCLSPLIILWLTYGTCLNAHCGRLCFSVRRNIELTGGISYISDTNGSRCFSLEELNSATKDFSNVNLIGYGSFGEVYKGLLQDGMIVAIKRRVAAPSQDFIEEVVEQLD